MKRIAIAVLFSVSVFGALPAGTTWEVRHAGANTNGGGFVAGSGGTDYSQQNSAEYSFTDLVSATGTTNPCTVTSVSHGFVSGDVGNIIQISAGTNWTTGFYEVVSVLTGTATLDRACASSASVTGGTWAEGGALGSLTELNTAMNTTASIQQFGWVKADATYTISSGIVFNFTNVNVAPVFVAGYFTTRGDLGQPTIQATTTSFIMVSIQNNNNLRAFTFENFIMDCNSEAGVVGFQISAFSNRGQNLGVINFNAADAFDLNESGSQGVVCMFCTATGGTNFSSNYGFTMTGSLLGSMCIYCQVTSSNASGFQLGGGTCLQCVAANLTGASANGFAMPGNSGGPVTCNGCTAYKVGGDGFNFSASPVAIYPITIINSASISNGGWGFNNSSGMTIAKGAEFFDYIATYNNVSGAATGITLGGHSVALSGDPYVNGTSNNFALNNVAGAGAAMKAAGYPGTLGSGGTGFAAIGTLQPTTTPGAGQVGYGIIQ